MYKSDNFDLLYFPVPKIGCTTTKRAIHVAENNNFVDIDIHKFNRSELFKNINFENIDLDQYYKFCIVRDPVERFISIYNGRILGKKDLQNNTSILQKYKLPKNPTIGQFINRLADYRNNKSVEHHVKNQVAFLGDNPDFYDDIFNLKDINSVIIPMLEEKCGFKINFDMTINKSKKVSTIEDLNQRQIMKIKNVYKRDYEVYGDYF